MDVMVVNYTGNRVHVHDHVLDCMRQSQVYKFQLCFIAVVLSSVNFCIYPSTDFDRNSRTLPQSESLYRATLMSDIKKGKN
jgi:hypothetical protein